MNFERLCTDLPVAPLLAAIQPDWWRHITIRQDFLGSAHHATQCIYLRGPAGFSFEECFVDHTSIDYPLLPSVIDVLMPVLRPVLRALRWVELGRLLLVRLPAGAALEPHIDEGAYAEHFERYHVALSTNEQCALVVDGEAQPMAAGEAWRFDHRKTHHAYNTGSTDRVHLIIDAVPYRSSDGVSTRLAGPVDP